MLKLSKILCAPALALAGLALSASGTFAADTDNPSATNPSDEAATTNSENDLAKKLSNPIASLISVPFQFNYDGDIGPVKDGDRFYMNVQPVVPIALNDDWNLIIRTILPVISQDDIFPGAGHQFGIGDITQSFFFSPAQPTSGGLIWGVGLVLQYPVASDDLLGSEKWSAGPTAVALVQRGGWTMGVLANHIWSFAGDDNRSDISATYVQPFITYTTAKAWTFSLNTETNYDWEAKQWSVPINVGVSKLLVIERQPISLSAGVRYWADSPDTGAHGWGARFGVTFLFPKN